MSLPYQQDPKLNKLQKYMWINLATILMILVGSIYGVTLPKTDNPTQDDWNKLYIFYIITFGFGFGGFAVNGFFWNSAIDKRDRQEEIERDRISKLPITSGEAGL